MDDPASGLAWGGQAEPTGPGPFRETRWRHSLGFVVHFKNDRAKNDYEYSSLACPDGLGDGHGGSEDLDPESSRTWITYCPNRSPEARAAWRALSQTDRGTLRT